MESTHLEQPITILINSLGKGGAERQVSLLAKKVPIKRIVLLTNEISYPVPSDVELVVLSQRYENAAREALKFPFYLAKLRRLITADDAVLSFLTRSNQLNVLLSAVMGHGCYVSERTYPSQDYRSGVRRVLNPLVRGLYRRASHVFVNSGGVKQDLYANFGIPAEAITVVMNGIEAQVVDPELPVPPELEALQSRKILMHVGRFHAEKNQPVLIRAFAEFAKDHPEWCLVLIGDGHLMPACRALVAELGLEQRCFMLGRRPEPRGYLRYAHAFAFPSRYEGFPNCVLEALAEGVPVLSSDCRTGPREILDDKDDYDVVHEDFYFARYGGLVPLIQDDDDENVSRFSRGLRRFLNDDERMTAYAAGAKLRAQAYDLDAISMRWVEALAGLERKRRG